MSRNLLDLVLICVYFIRLCFPFQDQKVIDFEQQQLEKMQKDFEIIFHDKLGEDESLKQKWQEVKKSEVAIKAQFDSKEAEMKERWKKDVDEIAEENKEIEEAWNDLKYQEKECDELLKSDSLSEKEKDDVVLEKEKLLEAKSLLKLEEEKVATKERKVLDAIEVEMDRWEIYKKQELDSVKKLKKDLAKECGSSDLDNLIVKIEEQETNIAEMVHELKKQDISMHELEKQIDDQKKELLREKEDLISEKEKLNSSQCQAVIKLDQDIIAINDKLNDMDSKLNVELREIQEERERLVFITLEHCMLAWLFFSKKKVKVL